MSLFSATPITHIAFIMDGNMRWAKKHMVPGLRGHQRGAEVAKEIVLHCRSKGIKFITLYAFSSENWHRPPKEVDDLLGLFAHYLDHELEELHKFNVRINVIGNTARFPTTLQEKLQNLMNKTKNNQDITLTLALSYGAKEEITQACRTLALRVQKGELNPDQITESMLHQSLYDPTLPDPDMIIRTSGEQRLSNFLLWQAAYSELFFIPTLWPDFTAAELDIILQQFQQRERRYGVRK